MDSDAKYAAVFNWDDGATIDTGVDWPSLKRPEACVLRDLWPRENVGTIEGSYRFCVEPHGSGLYKLSPAR